MTYTYQEILAAVPVKVSNTLLGKLDSLPIADDTTAAQAKVMFQKAVDATIYDLPFGEVSAEEEAMLKFILDLLPDAAILALFP